MKRKPSTIPFEMKGIRFKVDIDRVFRLSRIKQKERTVGYRSQVAYTIRFTPPYKHPDIDDMAELKKCKESFYTFLAEAKTKFPSSIADEHLSIDEPNMALNFLADAVKWYEDYEDVKCHTALLQLAQEWAEDGDEKNGVAGNTYIGGIFMRIGEETDDITEESFGNHDWEWMCISRQIVVDWA
jgi:hypothetical protein